MKTSKILFVSGLSIAIIGIITGVILALFIKVDESFNWVLAFPIWLISVFVGCIIMSLSGTFAEIQQKKSRTNN